MKKLLINNKYFILNSLSIDTLLIQQDLQSITVDEWSQIFTQLYGKTFPKNLRKVLTYKINQYDKSPEVNSFIYNNNSYWFDKDTRVGLMNLANCSGESMEIVLGDNIIEISTEKFKKFLQQLEVYAAKCFVNTQKHLNEHKKLNTVEELIDYDYTSGYPEKITLE